MKEAPRASDATPVLAARPYGGVTKAKRKQKPLSRGQRWRHEKGLARAEVIQDQMSKKVDDASSRLKKRRERKKVWDEVNSGAAGFENMRAILGGNMDEADGGDGDGDGDEWEDEEMHEDHTDFKIVDGVKVPPTAPATKLVVVDRMASATNTDVDDEVEKIT